MSRQVGDRVVVLGASMAGLLAARVLADAFAQVTVVDRDQLPKGSAQRRGVPQGDHLHALLARGQQALEELFPGLTAALVAQGVPAGDMLANARLYLSGYRLRQAHTGLVLLCASRPVLEGHVRARVRELANVAFLDSCDIMGLAATPDGRRVTGARVQRREGGNAEEVLGADLVVDATGRGSRTPPWLETLGYARPVKDEVRIGLGYATRNYRLPRGALGGDLAALHGLTPQHPRGGALQVLDAGRLMVTLGGVLGDHPPHRPRRLSRLRPIASVPGHLRDDLGRRAAGRPGCLPLPGQRAAPLRTVDTVSRRLAGAGRRRLQLQPHLRPGHHRGRAGGAGPAPPPRAGHPAPAAPRLR
jgi:hypothetical protein